MIKINKRTTNLPAILTSQKAINSMAIIERKAIAGTLTSNDFDSSIYGNNDVKDRLKEDQHEKCAYCETSLVGDFAPVEHYRPKTQYMEDDGSVHLGYYWLAYDWTNLLCSCDKCNSAARKGILFPLRDPSKRDIQNKDISQEEPLIINPAEVDPKDHINFRKYVAVPINQNGTLSDIGKRTIDIFDLNGLATNNPNKELIEDRKRIWKKAAFYVNSLIELGIPRAIAIGVVQHTFGSVNDQYTGMIIRQLMWP